MKKRASTKSSSRRASSRPAQRGRTLRASARRSTRSRSSKRGGVSRSKSSAGRRKMSSQSSRSAQSRSARSTTDHDEIREWAESLRGRPAIVTSTARGGQGQGVLRIDFPGFSGEGTLQELSWDEWFRIFDEQDLAFLYQDKQNSRFNKLVSRDRSTQR